MGKKQEEKPKETGIPAKIKKISRSLHVPLTQEEFNSHAVELAKLMTERDAVEANMTSSRSMFKSQIDEITAKIAREKQLVQEGKEWRTVPCVQEFDYDDKTVTVTVQETGEIIESRAMLLSEMQIEMQFNQEPAPGEDVPETE